MSPNIIAYSRTAVVAACMPGGIQNESLSSVSSPDTSYISLPSLEPPEHMRHLSHMFSLIGFATSSLSNLRPWQVNDWHDEKAVGRVGDTGKGIVPCGKSSQDSEYTTSNVALVLRNTIGGSVVSDSQHQESQVQGEEEEEECDRGFQGAEEEDGGKDKPALLVKSVFDHAEASGSTSNLQKDRTRMTS